MNSNLNQSGVPTPTLGPMVPMGGDMEPFTTPAWIEVEGCRFHWDAEEGTYPGLYVEPWLTDGTLTEDIYYEIEG
ncbi:hypothetical protein ARHIZOSPH14_27330 [Agromyces rhizosphaerae]|uniref:Uncharacterized protein n=1 Tax=Agromyces rhizosphaerae TaxID=88374 RepID=A0A9W6CYT6_9MICO|nr:hypothetical protein [Agromyces rhizosphaerae]GLI28491.1 hypothetical protein ARHIZOSPH14_27330 [Agromyces rhizosphaerae]